MEFYNSTVRLDFPMEKLDVIKHADLIRTITADKQFRSYADSYSLGCIDRISSLATYIVSKEYEQIKMPRVFDAWYQHEVKTLLLFSKMEIIMDLNNLLVDGIEHTSYENKLREWIFEGNDYSNTAFEKCINAINNGYKVEGKKYE